MRSERVLVFVCLCSADQEQQKRATEKMCETIEQVTARRKKPRKKRREKIPPPRELLIQ